MVQSWRGMWWVGGDAERRFPGTLYHHDDGRLRLELVGGFDVEVRSPLPGGGYAVAAEPRDLEIIHGDAGVDRITLLDSHTTDSVGIFAAAFGGTQLQQQDWAPTVALRGIHLASASEPVFVGARLHLERLLHWTDRSTLDLTLLLEGHKVKGQQVGRREVPPVAVEHGQLKVGLYVRGDGFDIKHRPVSNQRSLEANEWAELSIESSAPVPYNAFDTIDKDMQDLLTLAAYGPCGSLARTLIVTDSVSGTAPAAHRREVEVMGRQVYRTASKDREPRPNYIFTLGNIAFDDLVPKWLTLKEAARMGCNILFGLRYISTGYVGTRLLGVASAAESIHAALCPTSTPLPRAQYKALKRKLLTALEDESEDVRAFVNNGLQNNPTYLNRMLELASIPDAQAVDRVLHDRTRWATMLKNARNDLAHANERSDEDDDPTPALWLLEVTYALLCLVLMARLGFDADVQRAAAAHPKIAWASTQYRKVLAADGV